jgi:predicted  nucleic acid-binding Zn ribbon protein
MHSVEMRFTAARPIDDDVGIPAVQMLLGALRQNGQILGTDFTAARKNRVDCWFVSVPEKRSLSKEHANQWVAKATRKLAELGIRLRVLALGHDPESVPLCRCRNPPWFVLFTNYISTESPLRCGKCFGTIPLYRLPATSDDSFYDVVCWQSDYRACDRLQMNCSTGERFGTRQMEKHDSSLSSRGRAICDKLTEGNGVPVFYYLYRGAGRSLESERRRPCPSCGSAWLAEAPHCDLFDMKCDRCRLVSNIGWNVRR